MDNLLSGLFGGADNDDDEVRRNRANDFVSRVQTGSPYEGFTEEEALHNYQHVASRLSDDEYEQASREAFERLSPEERRQFARYLREQGNVDLQDDIDDPYELARHTNRVRSSQGSGLAGLLGGGGMGGLGGGGGSNDIMGALGGLMGGGGGRSGAGGMMGNPMMKAVLGQIAASAMKKYTR